jgi:hypothetical protein
MPVGLVAPRRAVLPLVAAGPSGSDYPARGAANESRTVCLWAISVAHTELDVGGRSQWSSVRRWTGFPRGNAYRPEAEIAMDAGLFHRSGRIRPCHSSCIPLCDTRNRRKFSDFRSGYLRSQPSVVESAVIISRTKSCIGWITGRAPCSSRDTNARHQSRSRYDQR